MFMMMSVSGSVREESVNIKGEETALIIDVHTLTCIADDVAEVILTCDKVKHLFGGMINSNNNNAFLFRN